MEHGTGQRRRGRIDRWALPALLLVALLLRLPGLDESLWLDETFCSHIKIGTPLDLARTVLSDYHPPLYFVLMHLWIGLFGDSEPSLRLIPLLSGLLSILVVARLGERLLGRAEGLAAAILLALSPTHVWYSQEARPYATTMLLVLCAAWAYFALDEDGLEPDRGRRRTWAFGLALGAALFCHYYVLAFAGAFAALPWLCGHRARLRVTLCCTGIGFAFALFLLAKSRLGAVATGSEYLGAFGPAEAWDLLTNWSVTGNAFTPRGVAAPIGGVVAPLVALLCAALLILGSLRLWRERLADRRRPALLVLLLCLPALCWSLTLLGFDHSYIERSALPALPFLALVLAAGLHAPRRLGLRRGLAACALSALVAALGFARHNEGRWTVYKPNPDWRGVAAWLGPRLDRLGTAVPMLSSFPSPYALSYYESRARLAKTFEPADDRLERGVAALESSLGRDGLGGWLADRLRAGYAEHRRRTAELRRSLRLEIHDLGPGQGTKVLDGPNPPTRLYLLCWPGEAARDGPVRDLCEDPRIRVHDRAEFRMLEIRELELGGTGR